MAKYTARSGKSQKTLIRKAVAESEFVVILNVVAQDRSISYEARGLFVDLMSRPGDWAIQPAQLEIEGAKRDKIRRMLAELERAGLLVTVRVHGEGGRFVGVERVLYSYCQGIVPETDLPAPVNPQYTKERVREKKDPPALPVVVEDQKQQQMNLPVDSMGEGHALRYEDLPENVRRLLKFDALGFVNSEGLQRVIDCCDYADEVKPRNPCGFVRSALIGGWVLPVDVEREKRAAEDDPERFSAGKYAGFFET